MQIGSDNNWARCAAGRAVAVVLLVFIVGTALAQIDETEEGGIDSVLVDFLADWLDKGRDDAIARGVEPVPAEVRDALGDAVPDEILDNVRWRIDGEAGLVGPGLFAVSSAFAVTLDNVIIFAGEDEASQLSLWAHELYHVMQYHEWGVEGFIRRYLDDRRAVEHQANEFQYRLWKSAHPDR
jgi:hypothetical protein